MPFTVNDEIFLTPQEAKEMLGGVSDQTLRTLANRYGIQRHRQLVNRNIKYYRKEDIERLIQMRPVEDDKEDKA